MSGNHPVGPWSGHGCCSDVLPPFSVSNQLLESNSVSPCDNAIQWQTSSFQILLYIVHPSLLWAPNRSFSCWLPVMKYGWPSLFVHSRDMSIPFHSPFLSSSILCYFLPIVSAGNIIPLGGLKRYRFCVALYGSWQWPLWLINWWHAGACWCAWLLVNGSVYWTR